MNTNFDAYFDRLWEEHHGCDQNIWGNPIPIDAVFSANNVTYRMVGELSPSVDFDLGKVTFYSLDAHSMWIAADKDFEAGSSDQLDAAYAAAQTEWDCAYDDSVHPMPEEWE